MAEITWIAASVALCVAGCVSLLAVWRRSAEESLHRVPLRADHPVDMVRPGTEQGDGGG